MYHTIDKRTFRQQKCYRNRSTRQQKSVNLKIQTCSIQGSNQAKSGISSSHLKPFAKIRCCCFLQRSKVFLNRKAFYKAQKLQKNNCEIDRRLTFSTWLLCDFDIKLFWLDHLSRACAKHVWWSKKCCEILYLFLFDLDPMVLVLKFYLDGVMIVMKFLAEVVQKLQH